MAYGTSRPTLRGASSARPATRQCCLFHAEAVYYTSDATESFERWCDGLRRFRDQIPSAARKEAVLDAYRTVLGQNEDGDGPEELRDWGDILTGLACCFTDQGRCAVMEEAFGLYRRLPPLVFDCSHAAEEVDLEGLRSEPRFQALLGDPLERR